MGLCLVTTSLPVLESDKFLYELFALLNFVERYKVMYFLSLHEFLNEDSCVMTAEVYFVSPYTQKCNNLIF